MPPVRGLGQGVGEAVPGGACPQAPGPQAQGGRQRQGIPRGQGPRQSIPRQAGQSRPWRWCCRGCPRRREDAPGDNPVFLAADEVFDQKDATCAVKEEVVYLDLSELYPFKDHSFQVQGGAEMQSLVENVKSRGVNQPTPVRAAMWLSMYPR